MWDNTLLVGDAGDNDLWVYKVNASGVPVLLGKHSFEAPVSALTYVNSPTSDVADALVGDKVHAFKVNLVGSADVITETLPSVQVAAGDQLYVKFQGHIYADGYVLGGAKVKRTARQTCFVLAAGSSDAPSTIS